MKARTDHNRQNITELLNENKMMGVAATDANIKDLRKVLPAGPQLPAESNEGGDENSNGNVRPKDKVNQNSSTPSPPTLDPFSPLASTTIISTASAKLSYLIDRIMEHQEAEKTIIFYEAENTAYYIAQALECHRSSAPHLRQISFPNPAFSICRLL